MNRHVVISGCSGGGKSTLLAALAARGHSVVSEPGLRIVRAGGDAMPWIDMAAFARRAISLSLRDRRAARETAGWTFFDRGLVDAATALDHVAGTQAVRRLCPRHPYHRHVFLAPPWPEIHVTDAERRHGFAEAVAEYDRLVTAYGALGYERHLLPRIAVEDRADWLLARLDGAEPKASLPTP